MKGGMAGVWADQVAGEILEGRMPYVDYADFIKAVTERFGDPDAGTTARRKLELVRQGDRSVDEYVSEFQTYAPRTGYDETALVEFFQRGLSQKTLAKIYNLPNLPIALSDWVTYASRFDRQYRAFEARRGPSENRRPAPTSTGRSAPTTPTPPKMSAPSGTTKTTATVKQEARTPRLCWKCNSPDHLSRECTAPEADRMRTLIREVLIGMRDDVAAPKEKEKEEEKETTEDVGFLRVPPVVDTSWCANRFSSLVVEDISSNGDALPASEKTENVPDNPNPPESTPPRVKRRLIRNT